MASYGRGLIPARAGTTPVPPAPPRYRRHLHATAGLIPARAGTTQVTAKFVEEHGAHPRSRGDHDTRTTPGKHLRGSSPLARGPHFGALFPPAEWGLIPARAGTTAKRTWDRKNARAHPRSRGDHRRRPVRRPACRGSSPLARGPRVASLSPRASRGLIPARAGTTGGRLVRPCRLGAHPRSRGDHCDSGCRCNSEQGSSPLARGTPRH